MKYCPDCGYVGEPEENTPGSLKMEVVLWLLFVVPGLLYSAWRWSARGQACAHCGNTRLVATDSPVARAAFAARSPSKSMQPWACLACGEPIFRGGTLCPKCGTPESKLGHWI